MKTINLHGKLAEKYGSAHQLDIRTPAEAIRALTILLPGFERDVSGDEWKLVTKRPKSRKGRGVLPTSLHFPLGRAKELHLIPKARAAGIEVAIIAGFALVAAAVVVGLTMAPPIAQNANNREIEETNSFLFDGPTNVSEQGHPLYLTYGEMEIGSIVGAASLEAGDMIGSTLPSFWGGGGSGSTGGFGGNLAWEAVNSVLNKGGKGGGSTRSAQEDPNTLQSESTARIFDILGEGECEGPARPGLQWVKLNGVPLENTDGTFNNHGVDIQTILGLPTQEHIRGQNGVGVTALVGTDITIAGGAVTQTITDPDTTRCTVTLEIPALWKQNLENGDLERTSVAIKIELQSAGGGFTTIYNGANINDRANFSNQKNVAPYQRDYPIELPAGGAPWVIRMSRITPDGTAASISNDTIWKFITPIIDAQLTYPYTAGVGLTVSARQFGTKIPKRSYLWKGLKVLVPSNYDPLTRVYTGQWDGTFIRAWTDNPAWVYYDLCTNSRYGLGNVLTNRVDKWGLYDVARHCDELVDDGYGGQEARFTCNVTITKQSAAYRVLNALASSFRAMTFWNTRTLSVVQDVPADPWKLVGPTNTGEGKITYSSKPRSGDYSAWVVTWNDPSEAYKQNFEVVEDPDLIRQMGWKSKEVAAFACTSRGQAHRFGQWLRDDQLYAREQMRTTVGADHADCGPGRIIKVSDPTFTGKSNTGRIKAVTSTTVTLDRPVDFISGATMKLSVVLPDGIVKEQEFTGNAIDSEVAITFASTLRPIVDAMWVLESDQVVARQFRVTKLSEVDDNDFNLEGTIHDPNKYLRVEQGIDLTPENYVGVPSGPILAPAAIGVQEFLRPTGNSVTPALRLSWSPSTDPRTADYEAQVRPPGGDSWTPLLGVDFLSRDIDNVAQGDYSFRVRSVDALNTHGPWRLLEDQPLVGPATALPEVTGLTSVRDNIALQTSLRWAAPVDVRPYRYRIYRAASGTFGNAAFVGETDQEEYVVTQEGVYWVQVAFMDERSTTPPSIEITDDELPSAEWTRVEGRPTSLSELDAAAANIIATLESEVAAAGLSISALQTSVSDLETTYGSTASAAASAAAAAASESAATTAASNSATAQGLAESARDAALTAEVSATESAGVSVTAAAQTFPSTFENADLYFSHNVLGAPNILPDVTDDLNVTAIIDPTNGAGLRVDAEEYITHKEARPYIVGNIYRIRALIKEVTPPTNSAPLRIIFRSSDAGFTTTANNSSLVPTPSASATWFETEWTANQANYDAGKRWVRGEVSFGYLAGAAAGDGVYEIFRLEFEDITQQFQSAASAAAAATSESAAGASETSAGQHASAAQTARTSAETAEANALSSETAAATSETNAAGSASSAATSETNAAGSETAAGASATAASGSASTATTQATDASSSASSAASSLVSAEAARDTAISEANDAAISASSSSASAISAAASETEAGQSAVAASTSETNASTSAGSASTSAGQAATSETNAAGSASAAASNAIVAADAATAAQVAALVTHPHLLDDRSYFGSSGLTSLPTVMSDLSDVIWTTVNDPDIGDSFESNAKRYIATKHQYALGALGDHWNFYVKGKPITDSTGVANKVNVYLYYFDASRAFVSSKYVGTTGSVLVSGGVFELDITIDLSATAPANAVYFRPYLYNNVGSGAGDGVARFSEFKIEDVTARIAAEQAASAAATSASAASASETEAGSFATASQTSANEASTSASNASTSETSAAASATTATASEAAASSSETVAASAAAAATSAAIQTSPRGFSNGTNYHSDNACSGNPSLKDPVTDDYRFAALNTTDGDIVRFSGNGTRKYISPISVLPVILGHTYRAEMRVRCSDIVDGTGHIRPAIKMLGDTYANVGVPASSVNDLAENEIKTITIEHKIVQANIDAGALYIGTDTWMNYSLVGGVYPSDDFDILYYYIEDVTETVEAAASALASASSASFASASETAAGQSAGAAQTSETNASTFAGAAGVSEMSSALSASSSAASASDAAAAVSTAQSILSVVASVNSPGNIVKNGAFAKWNDGAERPVGFNRYGAVASGTTVKEETITWGGNPCIRQTTNNSIHYGFLAYTYVQSNGGTTTPYGSENGIVFPLDFARYWVVEAKVYLVSGSWDGAGIFFNSRSGSTASSGGSSYATRHLDFADENLPTGKWVIVRKFHDFGSAAPANVDGAIVYGMSNYSGYGSGFTTKDIIWDGVSARPATNSEITNETAFPDLQADVTVLSSTAASLEGYAAAQHTITTGAGGALSQLAIRSVTSGLISYSDIKLSTDKVIHEIDGEVVWFADAEGITLNKALRFTGGGTTNNPDTMYVIGLGFGANSDLMEWFGPYSTTIDGTTKTNGIRAKTTDGKSYLNGTDESAAVITASDTDPVTAELSSIASNGNDVEVTAAGSASYSDTIATTSSAPPWATPPTPTMTIKLERKIDAGSYTVVTTKAVTGTSSSTSIEDIGHAETGLYIHTRTWSIGGSINHTQAGSGSTSTIYGWKVTLSASSWSPSQDTKSLTVSCFETN